MKSAFLEHVNIAVSDPEHTSAWQCEVFGWKVRWSGPSSNGARTVHVGTEGQYLALRTEGKTSAELRDNYVMGKSLNHICLRVDDLAAMKARVQSAGFTIGSEQTYDPGSRFYFYDQDGVEYEIVSYA